MSIDEMMKNFIGRSIVFGIKNNPLKEGYKLWEIFCAATGFLKK